MISSSEANGPLLADGRCKVFIARSPWSARRQKYLPARRSRARRRESARSEHGRRITALPRWSTATPPARPATAFQDTTPPAPIAPRPMIRRRPPTQGSRDANNASDNSTQSASDDRTTAGQRSRRCRRQRRQARRSTKSKSAIEVRRYEIEGKIDGERPMLPRAIRNRSTRPIRTARLRQRRMRLRPRLLR